MKQITLLAFLLLGGSNLLKAQTSPYANLFKASIYSSPPDPAEIGYLSELKEASIVIVKPEKGELNSIELKVKNIQRIHFLPKGKLSKGTTAGIGLIGGFLAGFIVSSVALPEPCDNNSGGFLCINIGPTKEDALAIGLLSAVPGAIFGSLIGTKSIKFRIRGDLNIYQQQKSALVNFIVEF